MAYKRKDPMFDELLEHVAGGLSITKELARQVIAGHYEFILDKAQRGFRVRLPNVGAWETRKRAQTMKRNPKTYQLVRVPETTVIVFAPCEKWKKRVAAKL